MPNVFEPTCEHDAEGLRACRVARLAGARNLGGTPDGDVEAPAGRYGHDPWEAEIRAFEA